MAKNYLFLLILILANNSLSMILSSSEEFFTEETSIIDAMTGLKNDKNNDCLSTQKLGELIESCDPNEVTLIKFLQNLYIYTTIIDAYNSKINSYKKIRYSNEIMLQAKYFAENLFNTEIETTIHQLESIIKDHTKNNKTRNQFEKIELLEFLLSIEAWKIKTTWIEGDLYKKINIETIKTKNIQDNKIKSVVKKIIDVKNILNEMSIIIRSEWGQMALGNTFNEYCKEILFYFDCSFEEIKNKKLINFLKLRRKAAEKIQKIFDPML